MLTEISAQYNRINRENFMIAPLVRQPGKSLPEIHQSENAEQQKGNHMESVLDILKFANKYQLEGSSK